MRPHAGRSRSLAGYLKTDVGDSQGEMAGIGISLPFDPGIVNAAPCRSDHLCLSRRLAAKSHLVESDRAGFGRQMAIVAVPNGSSSGKTYGRIDINTIPQPSPRARALRIRGF